MICPVELTSEMSAFQAACSKAHVGGKHEALQRGRRGADDEDSGSDPAGTGEEDLGGKPPRLSASVIARCGAGRDAMSATATMDCMTAGGASRARDRSLCRPWSGS